MVIILLIDITTRIRINLKEIIVLEIFFSNKQSKYYKISSVFQI